MEETKNKDENQQVHTLKSGEAVKRGSRRLFLAADYETRAKRTPKMKSQEGEEIRNLMTHHPSLLRFGTSHPVVVPLDGCLNQECHLLQISRLNLTCPVTMR